MDYEKMYNEALDTARALKTTLNQDLLETIFPELSESEDEKIRKLLVWQVHRNIEDETNDLAQSVYDGIKGHDPDIEESIEDWKRCLAWLEKQKEQKPVSFSCGHENDTEWSEEDEKMLDSIIKVVCGVCVQPNGLREKQVSWLKSLRPQYHGDVTMTEAYKMGLEAGKASSWKPSEEQIEALVAATLRYQSTGLESLYEDLKKLKYE